MQVFALSLAAALYFAALAPVNAQGDLKIGFVNVQLLLQNAPQTQAINERLRSEFAPREAELQSLAEEFQEKYETYERDAPVMAESERLALERELEQGNRDLTRRQETLQEDFEIRQEELFGELQQTIGRQVQEYAESEGYDLLLANVIFVSDAVDITEDVLAAITDSD